MREVVQVLRDRQKEARDMSEKLMAEALELEDYAEKLEPAIDLLDKLPELADSIMSKIGPVPNRRPRGQVMEMVLAHLRTVGPSKTADVEKRLDLVASQGYCALSRLRDKGKVSLDDQGLWHATEF